MCGDCNFDFDGEIFVGFSIIVGKDFYFVYDDYKVDLDLVWYFDLYVFIGNFDENNCLEVLSLGLCIEYL